MITQERLKEIVYYNDEIGGLFWRFNYKRNKVDKRCGYLHSRGYRHILIEGKIYKEHLLIWLGKNKNNTTGYKGVSVIGNKFEAGIMANRVRYRKTFSTLEEAVLYYNKLAVMYHKEFANLNILKPCA